MTLARGAFIVVALMTCAFALSMVTTQKLVRSLLLHVICLFLIGLIYLTAGAYLMGTVQIMVYAGSVSILLVFALMLTPVGRRDAEALDHQSHLRAGLAAIGLLAVTVYALSRTAVALEASARTPVDAVARSLFTTFAYPFELLSLVLLVALVGVAIIAGGSPEASRPDDETEESLRSEPDGSDIVQTNADEAAT